MLVAVSACGVAPQDETAGTAAVRASAVTDASAVPDGTTFSSVEISATLVPTVADSKVGTISFDLPADLISQGSGISRPAGVGGLPGLISHTYVDVNAGAKLTISVTFGATAVDQLAFTTDQTHERATVAGVSVPVYAWSDAHTGERAYAWAPVCQTWVRWFRQRSSVAPQDSIASDSWAVDRLTTARSARLEGNDSCTDDCEDTGGVGRGHVIGPPSCSSSRQRGTRNCFPYRTTGMPVVPPDASKAFASRYAVLRPTRNTAAASSKVRKSGGALDTDSMGSIIGLT